MFRKSSQNMSKYQHKILILKPKTSTSNHFWNLDDVLKLLGWANIGKGKSSLN
jgi:hypothetical protein